VNGDLSTFERGANALVQAAKEGGFTLSTLPRGQDVQGFGFPSYDGGPNTPETQTYQEDDGSDRGGPITPAGDFIENILKGIWGGGSKAVGDAIGGVALPIALKAGFFVVGVILLVTGLWSALKSEGAAA
jgi:hypothetical protein